MGFGLVITTGEALSPLPDAITQWLVEARVEMELSKPSRYAIRFEDDICEGRPEIADNPAFKKDTLLGLFAPVADELECLVFGPVTKVRASSMLGGPGSWVEIHGEDRRALMGRVSVQAKYKGKASATAATILSAYGFTADTQDTLIEHHDQKQQLTQNATDLAFLEDVARRNNMELWLDYKVEALPTLKLTETAKLRTSPERSQAGAAPALPTLIPDAGKVLRVNPPPGECANVTKFDSRINFDKPASAKGFALSGTEDKALVSQLVAEAAPVDPGKRYVVGTLDREVVPPPEATAEEAFLAKDALVFEQSWFVEVDCSASLDQLDFIVRPHQIVEVANAGDALSGGYQVMKATHVVTVTDTLVDFTMRANGVGGAG